MYGGGSLVPSHIGDYRSAAVLSSPCAVILRLQWMCHFQHGFQTLWLLFHRLYGAARCVPSSRLADYCPQWRRCMWLHQALFCSVCVMRIRLSSWSLITESRKVCVCVCVSPVRAMCAEGVQLCAALYSLHINCFISTARPRLGWASFLMKGRWYMADLLTRYSAV